MAPALIGETPDAACELCVAIPVYNEQEGILGTLRSLASQLDLDGRPLNRRCYEVLLLANNCHDQTVPLARAFAEAHPTLRLRIIEVHLDAPHAHVGAARRLVMDEACRRLLRVGHPRGVIASTDGDTRVSPTWVAATLDEVSRGADAVGGRILSSRDEVARLEPGTRLYYRRDSAYRILRAAYDHALDPVPHNPWPRHFQYFGASLAVTASAYLAAGGLPVVHCLEDMALERALHRLDVRLRHSPESQRADVVALLGQGVRGPVLDPDEMDQSGPGRASAPGGIRRRDQAGCSRSSLRARVMAGSANHGCASSRDAGRPCSGDRPLMAPGSRRLIPFVRRVARSGLRGADPAGSRSRGSAARGGRRGQR